MIIGTFVDMSVIFILIVISLIVATGFLLAFMWAVKNGQYEDDYSPAVRMLFDEETTNKEEKETPLKPNKVTNVNSK